MSAAEPPPEGAAQRRLQLHVGLLTLLACGLTFGLAVKFGDLAAALEDRYPLHVHFTHAPGVFRGTPVSKNGLTIGKVEAVRFDEARGGVLATLAIDRRYRLRADAVPHLSRSLLGDSGVEFVPGRSASYIEEDATLEGVTPPDPLKLVQSLGGKLDATLTEFRQTGAEWRRVGRNVNSLVGDNRRELDLAIARAAVTLEETANSMRSLRRTADSAQSVLGDPALQRDLKRTVAGLPPLVEQTKQTVAAVRVAVVRADAALANVEAVTRPLAGRGTALATKLDNTLTNVEAVSADLAVLSDALADEDGGLARFARDPSLYRNLDAAAENLNLLLANLGPVLRDLRVFSDKIARHPELIGVRGALRGSDGTKAGR